ncbi:MAG: ABC transporter permease [Actinomycetota bacterium]|nr:ABC transporter permease [Actinomycetota bacterium]
MTSTARDEAHGYGDDRHDGPVGPEPNGAIGDLGVMARRALWLVPRDPASLVPAFIVPLFFFAVITGGLGNVSEAMAPGLDYKAFQLPVAIVFAVTGISQAPNLVVDIRSGYFDRLLITPMRRPILLLGLILADVVVLVCLVVPVIGVGVLVGVDFATGIAGMAVFALLGVAWGIAFAGLPYAIALRTGSPSAVNASFVLFFPFAFLTSTFAPEEALSGWLAAVAEVNPVTYLLDGMRSLVTDGWDGGAIAGAVAAIVVLGALSHGLALAALRGRLRRG